ncbi:MAG TPA: cation transporter [Elusimicrobia bacterium]|nr:cation transporter [Elusimicrobiota bacterium]
MHYWAIPSLALIMALVLLLPFSVKRVEEELEIFLLVMGCAAMTVSGLWSWHIVKESLVEPVKISIAVLAAGFLFRAGRSRVEGLIERLERRIGINHSLFALIVVLGFLSSLLTAIIAALILCEIIHHLRLDRPSRIRAAVYACYAIGLGAALTPIGEPLSTIVTSKLQGPPHNAGFFWLANLLFLWITPAIIAVAVLAAYWRPLGRVTAANTVSDTPPETNKVLFMRAGKVYVFVAALVYLGEGLGPIAGKLIPALKGWQLYWLGLSSAALDNATLAAAGIVPSMGRAQILSFALSLLISGGILIPGNIPNIISAAKLDIKSREWAKAAIY